MTIERSFDHNKYDLNTAVSTTEEIDYSNHSGGQVHIPSGSSITSLTWHTAYKKDGTYTAAYNQAGDTAITQTVQAGRSYPIPVELFGCTFIKAVSDAAGEVQISFKS